MKPEINIKTLYPAFEKDKILKLVWFGLLYGVLLGGHTALADDAGSGWALAVVISGVGMTIAADASLTEFGPLVSCASP